ncbi:MAG: hypothetical protein AAGA86_01040 [Bacteroidota bacterium]
MKRTLIFICMGLVLSGCKEDDCCIPDCCANVDVGLQIKYINEAGENLFGLGDQGYDFDAITVYHKIDGEWQRYFKSNYDRPKGIDLVTIEETTWLDVFPSTTIVANNRSETKIEFSPTDMDIITTEIDDSNNNILVTRVWYNDVEQENRFFEIVK